MIRVLFVCSGNVFRSLSAEMAVRGALSPASSISVSSAGTIARPGKRLRADVMERLDHWHANYKAHEPRLLTREILDDADIVIAMSTDHQAFIRENFGRDVPTFMEITRGKEEPFLDLWEAVPDYRTNAEASRAFVHGAIDDIFNARSALIRFIITQSNNMAHGVKRGPAAPSP